MIHNLFVIYVINKNSKISQLTYDPNEMTFDDLATEKAVLLEFSEVTGLKIVWETMDGEMVLDVWRSGDQIVTNV